MKLEKKSPTLLLPLYCEKFDSDTKGVHIDAVVPATKTCVSVREVFPPQFSNEILSISLRLFETVVECRKQTYAGLVVLNDSIWTFEVKLPIGQPKTWAKVTAAKVIVAVVPAPAVIVTICLRS